MADFERSTTVGVGADAAFAYLSDPEHLPQYVSAMALVDDVAVDGDPAVEPERDAREVAPEARLLADAATRTVEWGRPGADYGGSMSVAVGTASTSQVVIRLHVRDDADRAGIDRMLDETVRNLQRLLSGR
jgi:Polyketide cyclase / dehydrase and lipid transport